MHISKIIKIFLKNMIFCNFRKFLMISVDLGLQCVSQVFNIFENRILSAQRTFGRSTKIIFWVDYNDSREKHVQSWLKVRKSLENHTTFLNIFWSEVAMLGANR